MEIQFIDLKRQQEVLKDKIDNSISAVLGHGRYVFGPEITELEDRLSEYVGANHAIACSSGTDALLLSLLSLDVKAGDEVIVPAFSFFATAEVVEFIGARPVFADINPDSYFINASEVEKKITSKTKAIMPVSLYGQVGEMRELKKIAEKHNVPVIEDAAQSFGASYEEGMSCGMTEMAATSFFPAKPLGCYGDGGAVFTSDDRLAEKTRMLLNHGQEERYSHSEIGINGRMDTIQAAILLAKFDHFRNFEVPKREEIGKKYTERLRGTENLKVPEVLEDRNHVYAQYTVEVENRDKVQEYLKGKGIPTAVHYPKPMYSQPALKKYEEKDEDYPVSFQASQKVMSLPMHPYLTDSEIDFVSDNLKQALLES